MEIGVVINERFSHGMPIRIFESCTRTFDDSTHPRFGGMFVRFYFIVCTVHCLPTSGESSEDNDRPNAIMGRMNVTSLAVTNAALADGMPDHIKRNGVVNEISSTLVPIWNAMREKSGDNVQINLRCEMVTSLQGPSSSSLRCLLGNPRQLESHIQRPSIHQECNDPASV
jgi:hypothetical protein